MQTAIKKVLLGLLWKNHLKYGGGHTGTKLLIYGIHNDFFWEIAAYPFNDREKN